MGVLHYAEWDERTRKDIKNKNIKAAWRGQTWTFWDMKGFLFCTDGRLGHDILGISCFLIISLCVLFTFDGRHVWHRCGFVSGYMPFLAIFELF